MICGGPDSLPPQQHMEITMVEPQICGGPGTMPPPVEVEITKEVHTIEGGDGTFPVHVEITKEVHIIVGGDGTFPAEVVEIKQVEGGPEGGEFICGGFTAPITEIPDEVKEMTKHPKFVEVLNASVEGCTPENNFEITSYVTQVVAGTNYKITGTCCGKTLTIVMYQHFSGEIQDAWLES